MSIAVGTAESLDEQSLSHARDECIDYRLIYGATQLHVRFWICATYSLRRRQVCVMLCLRN